LESKKVTKEEQKEICISCGRCCENFGSMQFNHEDVARWKKEERWDILEHPCIDMELGDIVTLSEIGFTLPYLLCGLFFEKLKNT
jgi:hypothetical protein